MMTVAPFGLNTLHDTLNRTLAEVVAVTLHGQTTHTNHGLSFSFVSHPNYRLLHTRQPSFQNTVRNEIFSCSVALNNGLNQIFWHISVVGK